MLIFKKLFIVTGELIGQRGEMAESKVTPARQAESGEQV